MRAKKIYRVSASVYPTNCIIAKRAQGSSGRVPLYLYCMQDEYLNFLGWENE